MVFGWAGQILKLDLSNMVASTVPTQSYTKHFIGGRGISVKMLYDEVKPKVSMFDPENKICFAPGRSGWRICRARVSWGWGNIVAHQHPRGIY